MKRTHIKTEPAFLMKKRWLNASKLLNAAAICSCLGILGLASAILASSDLISDSYAVDGASLNSKVTATVDGTHWVSLTASDVAFTVSPTDGAATDKKTVNVEVETNATGGAKLYLSTANDTNALFKDGDITSSAANVAAATGTTSLAGLANNTWAYSADDANYQGVPTQGSEALLATVDGTTTGTTSGGVISDTVPVYYAAKIDSSLPAGTYSNSVVYSAVVDGGIVTSADLTSITVDKEPAEAMQAEAENVILVTTNLKTNTYGTPRVYYTATDPSGYQECDNVVVGSNNDGYMTVTCTTAPTTEATNVTLHIVPKGEPSTGTAASNNLTGDPFCTDGTYGTNTSECESGEWKWGSFTVTLPDITPAPKPLMELTYMQEMTTKGCAASNVGDTKQLIDQRDNKQYWVAKLKDGNCWMTQNLELDLGGRTLTPQDSDVSSNWDHDAAGGNAYTSAQDGTNDNSLIQSWSLGKVVWKTPDSTGSCSGSGVYDLTNSACQAYWQDVSTWAPMFEYRTDGVTYDDSTQTYDAHYLAGNYYSYVAATAGSGAKVTTQSNKAPDSICPAGWELPTSYSTYNSTPGSFYNLLMNAYGLSSDSTGGTAMRSAPLFFVRSGLVTPSGHYLNYVGISGYYWSSVASSSSGAYLLSFSSGGINPSGYDNRYFGRPVRCVAPSA